MSLWLLTQRSFVQVIYVGTVIAKIQISCQILEKKVENPQYLPTTFTLLGRIIPIVLQMDYFCFSKIEKCIKLSWFQLIKIDTTFSKQFREAANAMLFWGHWTENPKTKMKFQIYLSCKSSAELSYSF